MATLGVQSRRKQSKPQRLPENKNGVSHGLAEMNDIAFACELDAQNESACAIDLSTAKKSFEDEEEEEEEEEVKNVADKGNLLLSLGIASPQQLLSLYAQLAGRSGIPVAPEDEANGDVGGALMGGAECSGSEPSPAPSSASASRTAMPENHSCPSANCRQVFTSVASLRWHVQEAHLSEELLECSMCGQRTDHRRMLSHRCSIDVRPISTGSLPMQQEEEIEGRRSAPVDGKSAFFVVTRPPSTSVSEPLSFLSHLFSQKTSNLIGTSSTIPLDLSSAQTQSIHPPMFPGFSGVPPSPLPHGMGGSMPPPFLIRGPFGPSPGDLFPRDVLANEEDWESLMEVSNTDEAEKIRALVGDKALPTTDPNQCILCRRVLSCKSALQMHYRTHTGERPFKCKICQRAFTTKGNLKTHMGVHRAKHSFRGASLGPPLLSPAQQCPICQKRFLSGPQLQAHIAEHTQQLRNPFLATSMANDKPPVYSPQPPSGLPHGFPLFPFPFPAAPFVPPMPPQVMPTMEVPPTPLQQKPPSQPSGPTPFNLAQMLGLGVEQPNVAVRSPPNTAEASHHPSEIDSIPSPSHTPSLSAPSATATITTTTNPILSALTQSLGLNMSDGKQFEHNAKQEVKLEAPQTESVSPTSSSHGSLHEQTDCSSIGRGDSESEEKRSQSVAMEEITPIKHNELFEMTQTDLTNDETKKRGTENPLEAMQKMWAEANTEAPPPRQTPVLSKHQCGVCFKHFSSSSALQIHMRTHTGDKPFKCDVCARAFTTRGNLKVHMGTHMWQQSPSRRGRRIFDAMPNEPRRLFENGDGRVPSVGGLPLGLPMPGFPFPFPPSAAGPSPNASIDMMMMLMRTVCSVCQKVCSSPSELEQHLKGHLSSLVAPSSEMTSTSEATTAN